MGNWVALRGGAAAVPVDLTASACLAARGIAVIWVSKIGTKLIHCDLNGRSVCAGRFSHDRAGGSLGRPDRSSQRKKQDVQLSHNCYSL